MPIDYKVALNGALVVEVWHGSISVDDLYDHREQQAQDPSIINGARILADIRLASFHNISQSQIEAFARSYRATESVPSSRSLAFIASNGFSKAQAYEKASRSFLRNVVVFTSLPTACKWLGIDVGLASRTISGILPGKRGQSS